MPYILGGKTISAHAAFTHDGIQYPAGWITRVSEESRQAIGLVWQPEPPQHDPRFWYGYSVEGELIPKDLVQLKKTWTDLVKDTAGKLLAPSDWVIIRSLDPSSGCEPSAEVLAERSLIREKSNSKEQDIAEVETVEELAAYVTSSEFSSWIDAPVAEAEEPPVVAPDPIVVIEDEIDSDEDPILYSAGTVSGQYVSESGVDSVIFDA